MDALEVGIPKLCGELAADGGGRAARAMMTTDTKVEGSRRARRRARPSAAWPRARRCCRPRWRRCSRSSPPTPRSTTPRCSARSRTRWARPSTVSRSTAAVRRTTPCSSSPTAAPAPSIRTRSPTRSPRCAARSPSRWRATPKARRSSCGCASSAPATTPRRASRRGPSPNSQLVQCSLNGNDPYWGRVLSELGASGAHLDPEAVDISYNGVTVCRDGVACAHDEAAITAALAETRHRDPLRPAARARRGDRAHHRSLARVHRREPAHVVSDRRIDRVRRAHQGRGREGAHPRRGAAVHPRVLGQDRRDQVRRSRDGERRSSPSCSRPTSCSCGSSA